jgi:RNA polymerase sigma-70 factor (ECF subfamily)
VNGVADTALNSLSDAELIVGMAIGDFESFRTLSVHYRDVLAALSNRIIGNETDAEEVVAETLWRAWRAAKDFEPRGSAARWLLTMARHRSIDHIRMRRSANRPISYDSGPDSPRSPSADLMLSERACIVRAALGQLEERERTVLQMAYYADFSHREIAERLGIPLGTVKTRIRTATSWRRVGRQWLE